MLMIFSGSRTLRATVAHGIKRRLLEHEAERAGAAGSSRSRPDQSIEPRVGSLRPAMMPQRRRLAAAGGAEQREELARPDIEVEAVERHHAVREGLADIVERDDGNAG